jgi:hypothetical protein
LKSREKRREEILLADVAYTGSYLVLNLLTVSYLQRAKTVNI